MKKLLLATALLSSLAACSTMYGPTATTAPAQVREGMLADSRGMTLYVFDKDSAGSGKSACNGPCATNWPPLPAADADKASGDWSVIVRDDGRRQWAYKGWPLHT